MINTFALITQQCFYTIDTLTSNLHLPHDTGVRCLYACQFLTKNDAEYGKTTVHNAYHTQVFRLIKMSFW